MPILALKMVKCRGRQGITENLYISEGICTSDIDKDFSIPTVPYNVSFLYIGALKVLSAKPESIYHTF